MVVYEYSEGDVFNIYPEKAKINCNLPVYLLKKNLTLFPSPPPPKKKDISKILISTEIYFLVLTCPKNSTVCKQLVVYIYLEVFNIMAWKA